METVIEIIERVGVPVAMCMAFGYFIWKQNQFIQSELQKEMRESFTRLEGIVIGLINALKKHTMDIKELKASYTAIVDIIQNLFNKKEK
jgi:uncharacterized protein (UPF0305 family)|tara:strand:- start:597 stop:863 length:267 start_codon:yes stop_codon:yes gene_type:complete